MDCCLIAMGLNRQPNIRMYWEKDWKISPVANRFTRKRFLAIKKYLHLADNTNITSQTTDCLAKIRGLMDLLEQNFKANYVPGQYLTVDEDICKFKGRSSETVS